MQNDLTGSELAPIQRGTRACTQVGLNYICATAERFFAVGAVLGNMVVAQAQSQEQPSQRLLKHIIRCYLRLSDNPRCVCVCVRVCVRGAWGQAGSWGDG